jgi:hypothetical protein
MIESNERNDCKSENVRPNVREGLDSGSLGRDTTGVQMLVARRRPPHPQPPDCYLCCLRFHVELPTIQTEKTIRILTRAIILFYRD